MARGSGSKRSSGSDGGDAPKRRNSRTTDAQPDDDAGPSGLQPNEAEVAAPGGSPAELLEAMAAANSSKAGAEARPRTSNGRGGGAPAAPARRTAAHIAARR